MQSPINVISGTNTGKVFFCIYRLLLREATNFLKDSRTLRRGGLVVLIQICKFIYVSFLTYMSTMLICYTDKNCNRSETNINCEDILCCNKHGMKLLKSYNHAMQTAFAIKRTRKHEIHVSLLLEFPQIVKLRDVAG